MNTTALFSLTYGLYVIGTIKDEKKVGCIVNTVTQSTSNPITITVCINKQNHTNLVIKQKKAFTTAYTEVIWEPKG